MQAKHNISKSGLSRKKKKVWRTTSSRKRALKSFSVPVAVSVLKAVLTASNTTLKRSNREEDRRPVFFIAVAGTDRSLSPTLTSGVKDHCFITGNGRVSFIYCSLVVAEAERLARQKKPKKNNNCSSALIRTSVIKLATSHFCLLMCQCQCPLPHHNLS